MAALLFAALLCQLPIAEDAATQAVYVCHVEAIEINHYTEHNGDDAVQLVFWEADRWDQHGKRWAVCKGYSPFLGELTFEDDRFVYRGRGTDYDVIEMRANCLMESYGYDSRQIPGCPMLRFEVNFRWW